ncbi:MAG TPA: septum formation initiator [Stellaceae bacterium]|nr:septum formation initiator [Stellaceae bacterium]
MARTIAVVYILLLFCGTAGAAQDPARPLPARIETHHALTLAGGRLDYDAIAETFALKNAQGATTAEIFTVSYLRSGVADGRSVTFAFNGGPGAAAVFLQLGALGPRILETPESGAVPSPPFRLVDNPATWLPFTDLVFVDPVGTGFSRGEGKGKDPGEPFWNVHSDLDSLASLVRLWLTRHQRWNAPVYLIGESYGGFRAAALARTLPQEVGVTVSGLVLVSPALDLSALDQSERDLLAAAFPLPSYAAAAMADNALPGPVDLTRIERFALSDYLVGLAGLKGDPGPGNPFIAAVAHMAGLPPEIVARHRGRIPRHVFARTVRRSAHEVVSLYDATVTRPASANPRNDQAGDPILDPAAAAYTAAFEHYAATGLGYRTELPYRALSHEVSRHWDWQGAKEGGGFGLAMASLQAVLLDHPATKLMIVNGRYDLVTPYFASRWLVDQLQIPAAVRAQIRLHVYPGGHMMYMRPSSRAALSRDAAALYGTPPR